MPTPSAVWPTGGVASLPDGSAPVPQFPEDRQQLILGLVDLHGSVSSSELAESMGVNPATIRRDLRQLADKGLVHLVHGGARRAAPSPLVREVDLMTKQVTNLNAKRIIAEKASALVSNGATVALNSGSTVEMVAARINPLVSGCTFVTLSLGVAATLAQRRDSTLLLAGGLYRGTSQSFVGDYAVNLLASLHADIAFLGASAVDVRAGWTHPALEEVRPNQVMLEMASKAYLVCDSSKFGVTGLARIAGLEDFTGIISDGELPPDVVSAAMDLGIEVL